MKKLFFAGLLTAIVGGSVVAASLPFSVLEDPLEGIQQRPTTYKVSGTLMKTLPQGINSPFQAILKGGIQ